MANYRAVANGNWNTGSTWAGGAVPPNGEGHNVYSNTFTVTIDTNVNVALITNAAFAGTFVGGGTAGGGGGFVVSSAGVTITSNISSFNAATTRALLCSNATGDVTINGNITGRESTTYGSVAVTGSGNVIINGNVLNGTGLSTYNQVGLFISSGSATINGNISCNSGNTSSNDGVNGNPSVWVSAIGNLTVNSGTITGGEGGSFNSQSSIYSNSSGVVTLNNCIINAGSVGPAVRIASGSLFSQNGTITATNNVNAINATVVNAYGTFVYSPNGTNPVGGARVILGTTPTNAYSQFALNGINSNSFFRYYTADNALGQANPTDVRSGVSYASGNLTGRLTVPARGSVALSVNYGPSMPFTATRSGTTATATLAYSYPLVVGDQITVTGASNTEWNSTYTIASVVSGTSVTFVVPATHSATAGAGATMQTTGTAVLDPAAVASAVWGAATRTLTSASGPTAVQIREEMDSNSTKLANLDATVSSRLAPSGTLATVTTLTNAPASVTPQQIRAEMDANSTKLANLDATVSSRLATSGYTAPSAAPTAAQNATAVWGAATKEITGGTVTTLTNAPSVPSAASIRAEIDSNSTQLAAIKAKTDLLPASPAATGDIPTAAQNATAVWSKPANELTVADSIGERAKQQSTVAITGAQLAAALS